MPPSEYRDLTTLIANELDRAQEEFQAFFVGQLDRCQKEFEAHFFTGKESLRAEIRLLAEAVRRERLAIDQMAASFEPARSGQPRPRAVGDGS